MKYFIGYDIGAISVNRVVVDEEKKIVDVMPYTRHFGEPVKIIIKDIEYLNSENTGILSGILSGKNNSDNLNNSDNSDNSYKNSEGKSATADSPGSNSYYAGLAFTGSGGKYISSLLKSFFVNEIEAIITAVKQFNPDVNTVIEIGGQDSKFIDLTLGDYSMNELCAAGTGSFLDQQASRFNLTIEQFADLALKSQSPSSIAGRCSVFAKSDMIHLQQEAAKDEDIALGLCYAMARSFKSGIIRGKKLQPPVIFAGGVSYNKAMRKAFDSVLNQDIIIPNHRASYGAMGAALSLIYKMENSGDNIEDGNTREKGNTRDNRNVELPSRKIDLLKIKESLENYLNNYKYKKEVFKPLTLEKSVFPVYEKTEDAVGSAAAAGNGKIDAYIGIDVGSISTNVVAIDENKKLLQKVYLRTSGRPIEAVRKGIEIIGDSIGDKINVKAVGTTGSGRYLIGDLVGADTIINEITAQATAAADIDREVDTIFEIGGQDSKYISLENGVVVDFEMNKICAAGTGSFLEEQAERFDIKIEEFGDRALKATAPLNLGERCTVFMETNVYSHYQKGASIEDILAGLAYSIAINYINRVVSRKKIGNRIFFQGAVAFNKSVIAAFENYLGKQIIVPENHEVTGAIGTAIKAMENQSVKTNFRGFEEIKNIKYSQSSFECHGCPNVCDIKKVTINNKKPLFYGGRCEKYEKKDTSAQKPADLFAQRDEILLTAYSKSRQMIDKKYLNSAADKPVGIMGNDSDGDGENTDAGSGRIKIGIPYTMLTYEFYPFWEAFFSELGFEVVLSEKTNKKIINDGLSFVIAETCFPMKVVLGHVKNLLDRKVDYIFVPGIRDMPCPDNRIEGARTGSYPCPFVQGISSFIKASMSIDVSMILDPLINFSFREYLKNDQLQKLGKKLGKNSRQIKNATRVAYTAQEYFYKSLKEDGKRAIQNLKEDEIAAVIVSRPYNSCDSNISMDIPGKLRDMGIQAIPLDYLPLDDIDLFSDWPNMYWEFGDRILSAVDIIKKDKRFYPVYITNFGCGPDSFIMQYFEREVDRPFLKMEVDEHTAGAGVITRCEAFYDSLKNISNIEKNKKEELIAAELTGFVDGEGVADSIEGKDSNTGKNNGNKINVTRSGDAVFKRNENRIIFIPHMGDGSYGLAAAFRSAGINAQVMQSDDETLEIGRKYTLGKECYPYIVTTGDILKTLKYNDPKKCAFLMPLTHGPCRFGQYNKMQKILLKELGYSDVPIVAPGAPESAQFYKEYDMEGKKGSGLLLKAMLGIFTIDRLNKLLRKTGPYEIDKGRSNEVYKKFLDRTIGALEKPSKDKISIVLQSIVKDACTEFSGIATYKVQKPRIGIVGEIYVRNHPFSNNEIIKKVEELGGEVEIPDFTEWAYHTNATSKLDISVKQKDIFFKIMSSFGSGFVNSSNGSNNGSGNGAESIFDGKTYIQDISKLVPNFNKGIKFYITNRFFKYILNRYNSTLDAPLKDSEIIDLAESDIYDIWDNAEPFIIKWFGEAALSVGKSIEWIKNDIDGIINVLPFTCMPGTMVTAISKRIREQYGVPWLNIAFDGLEQGTTETRLEAFMFQAKQYMLAKKEKAVEKEKAVK